MPQVAEMDQIKDAVAKRYRPSAFADLLRNFGQFGDRFYFVARGPIPVEPDDNRAAADFTMPTPSCPLNFSPSFGLLACAPSLLGQVQDDRAYKP
jgi:hypothetical protein